MSFHDDCISLLSTGLFDSTWVCFCHRGSLSDYFCAESHLDSAVIPMLRGRNSANEEVLGIMFAGCLIKCIHHHLHFKCILEGVEPGDVLCHVDSAWISGGNCWSGNGGGGSIVGLSSVVWYISPSYLSFLVRDVIGSSALCIGVVPAEIFRCRVIGDGIDVGRCLPAAFRKNVLSR